MAIIITFIVNAGLNFVLGLLVAKYLGPDEFGRFAVAQAIGVFIHTAFFDWIRLAAARDYTDAVRTTNPGIRATLDTLLMLTTLTVLSLMGAAFLSGIDFKLPAPLLAAAIVASIGMATIDFQATLMRARFMNRVYAFAVAVRHTLAFVLMLAGAIGFASATAVLIGLALSTLGTVGAFRHVVADPGASFSAATRNQAFAFMRYGVPLVMANAIYTAMLLLNRTLIAGAHDYAEAGQFSLAYDVGVRVLAVFGTALDVLLFTIAVRREAVEGAKQAAEQVARNMVMIFAFICPCAVGYWLIIPGFEVLFVPSAYRGRFAEYSNSLVPLILLFGVLNYVLNPVLLLAKRTWPLILAALFGFAANGIGLLFLPGQFGAMGYAHAALLGYTVATAVAVILAMQAMIVRPRPTEFLKVGLATLVMGAMLYPLRSLEPAIMAMAIIALAGCVIYAGLAWWLDIADLRRSLAKRLGQKTG